MTQKNEETINTILLAFADKVIGLNEANLESYELRHEADVSLLDEYFYFKNIMLEECKNVEYIIRKRYRQLHEIRAIDTSSFEFLNELLSEFQEHTKIRINKVFDKAHYDEQGS